MSQVTHHWGALLLTPVALHFRSGSPREGSVPKAMGYLMTTDLNFPPPQPPILKQNFRVPAPFHQPFHHTLSQRVSFHRGAPPAPPPTGQALRKCGCDHRLPEKGRSGEVTFRKWPQLKSQTSPATVSEVGPHQKGRGDSGVYCQMRAQAGKRRE